MRRPGIFLSLFCVAASMRAASLLDDGFRHMYNLQFPEAHRTFIQYSQQHPDDPMGPVGDGAAYLYSEFDRLRVLQSELFTENQKFLDFHKPAADPKAKANFFAAMENARQLVERALQQKPGDGNALFASTLRLGLRADYLA